MQPVASAWSTNVVSRAGSRAPSATTRSWSRRLPRGRARRPIRCACGCPTYAPTTPTSDEARRREAHRRGSRRSAAERVADHGWRGRRRRRIVKARIATRQVISRVRSSYDVGDLGRHRDVRHLEERVRRGAGQEAARAPSAASSAAWPMSGPAKSSAKRDGQRAAPARSSHGRRRPARVGGAVADPAGDRVEHDVPGLGQEHDQRRPPARRCRGCRSGRAAASGRARCRTRRSPPTPTRSRCALRAAAPRCGRRLAWPESQRAARAQHVVSSGLTGRTVFGRSAPERPVFLRP